jgi:hypothetical protein
MFQGSLLFHALQVAHLHRFAAIIAQHQDWPQIAAGGLHCHREGILRIQTVQIEDR